MSTGRQQHEGSDGAKRPGTPPQDAIDPPVQPFPHDETEAAADLQMAEAEEAVVEGGGTDDQRDSVARMASQRSQEDRRQVWLQRHPEPVEPSDDVTTLLDRSGEESFPASDPPSP